MSQTSPLVQRRIAGIAAVMVAVTVLMGCLCIVPNARGEDNSATVPEPNIEMRHQTGFTLDDRTIANDMWAMDVSDGDVTILLLARNLTNTQTNDSWIDYQSDINYHVGDDLYIAQITIMEIKFLIGDVAIQSAMDTCDKMEMTHTPVKYEGERPSFYCNITYSNVGLQWSSPMESSFNLTLSHHIVVDWNQTHIKVEAKFDLNETKLIDPQTGNEFAAGTPFAIEIPYSMMLTLPNSHGQPIAPSGHTDTSLEYNLTTSSGSPITVSKLTMNNNFIISNQTGSYGSMAYSSMQYGPQSMVTHGFPNLVYQDTMLVQSDPEITVYHDSLGGTFGPLGSDSMMYVLVIALVAIVAIVSVIFVVRKRKK